MLCASASPAAAEPAAAVIDGNILWTFDTATPETVTTRAITGIGAGEVVRGIDTRPLDGRVFVWTVADGSANNSLVSTYSLDTKTGSAALVGAPSTALPGAGDVDSGFDFQPIVDRVRFVNIADENARLNPNNGALSGNDTDLTPAATSTIIGAAYDRNRVGTPATTVFVLDRNNAAIDRLGGVDASPSPNSGALTELAPLGFTLTPTVDAGFDISPSGVAYAALSPDSDDRFRLYRLTIPSEATGTPAAEPIGPVFDGGTEVFGLTIIDDDRDQDGVLTTVDKCPAEANATADGCVAPTPAPPAPTPPTTPPVTSTPVVPTPALTLGVTGVSSRIKLATLRKSGLLVTATPNLASSLVVELRGTLKGTRLASANDIVLAEKSLRSAAGARKVRLKLSRANQRRLRKAAKLRVIVTATDALGRVTKVTRRVRIN